MSLLGKPSAAPSQGFPRVSGDEPYTLAGLGLTTGFSPRERG